MNSFWAHHYFVLYLAETLRLWLCYRTALEKCTHLYDDTQGTIKHKCFRQKYRLFWKCLCLIVPFLSSYRWGHSFRAVLFCQPHRQLFTHSCDCVNNSYLVFVNYYGLCVRICTFCFSVYFSLEMEAREEESRERRVSGWQVLPHTQSTPTSAWHAGCVSRELTVLLT